MPNVIEDTIQGWAHCRDVRCPGSGQQPVEAIRRETQLLYVDLGGDLPGVERSTAVVAFADETVDGPCPVCGQTREVTDQQRRVYAPMSGHDPRGLLDIQQTDLGGPRTDPLVAELQAQVAALTEKLEGR
jgi:hypothetical protein